MTSLQRPGERPLARAPRQGPADPRRRRDGHDAVRGGLQFGDPPEVWNLSHPDVVRRIHRGYLDAGSRIVLTNTFGGNRLRLRLHGHDDARRRAEPDGRDPRSAPRSTRPAAGPRRRRHRADRRDHGAARHARRGRGGRRLRRAGRGADRGRRRPDLDRDDVATSSEIGAAIRGVRRVAPGIPIIATMTFDTRGYTMMGVSPEQAVAALLEWGADAIGGNCGNGPDELCRSSRRCTPSRRTRSSSPSRTRACPSWSTCGRSTAPIRDDGRGRRSDSGRRAPGSSGPAAAARRPTSSGCARS